MNRINKQHNLFEILFIGVLCCTLVLRIIDIIIHGMESIQFDLYFLKTGDFFADFTNVVGYSAQRDPYNNTVYTGLSEKAYPPLVYCVMYLFSKLVHIEPYYEAQYFKNMFSEPMFLLPVIVCYMLVAMIGYELIRYGKKGPTYAKIGVAAVLLLSGPTLYTLERGNVLICVPFLCLAFLLFYNHENPVLQELGLISLAIAAGIKMTPAILGCILLFEHQWKKAFRTVCYGLCAFLAPFLFLKGGLQNLFLMFRNLELLMENYKNADGCSIRNILVLFFRKINLASVVPYISSYVSLAVAIGLFVYSFLTTSFSDRILALTLILVSVPNYSAYYCTMYFIPAIVLFLNNQDYKKTDWLILIGFLQICNPLKLGILRGLFDCRVGITLLLVVMAFRLGLCLYGTFYSKVAKKKAI